MDIIDGLPDISFIDGLTLEELQNTMVAKYQETYQEQTGLPSTLARGDPERIILLATSLVLYQLAQYVDKAGKMNYLKYAYGNYLDQLGATRTGTVRNPASPAMASVRWSLASARASATPIPAGSRVTADGKTYFATSEYAEIPAGDTDITLVMYCTTDGIAGNGFAPGELSTMVDPVPFVASVSNLDTSAGGAEVEDDDSYRQRIFIAPSSYSVAGPADAYVARCLSYSSAIADVSVAGSDEDPTIPPGTVDIRILMEGGEDPSQAVIDGLEEYLSTAPARPLTDHVVVAAPSRVSYSVAVTYYISKASRASAEAIQAAASEAVAAYEEWQGAAIGRDINPDELLSRLKTAGVKRAVITAPGYLPLTASQVASLTSSTVTYGGLEDD